MAASTGHGWGKQNIPSEIEDPVENMIEKTGCMEKHNAVQMCMFENRDWRRCQKEVADFRLCIEENQKRKKKAA